MMIFANGVKKAGTFKDNVLVELLPDDLEGVPQEFKS